LTSLFDASAIFYFIGRNEPERMVGIYTSDLSLYELGNAIWKESVLLKRLSAEERNEVLDRVSRVMSLMKVLRAEGHERRIMDVAAQLGVTYYDATYVYMAKALGASLVTVDRKLARLAKPAVRVVNPSAVSSPP
jgi:predicted nucleic acid-binding protein